MKNWRHLTVNPEAIASVFGEVDPSLNEVTILSLEVPQPISCLNLVLAMGDLPKNPPARWDSEAFNAITIHMQCLDLVNLSLKRREGYSTVTCKIEALSQDSAKYRFHLIGDGIDLSFECNWIRVNHLRPIMQDNSREAF